jgi:hypothetical protein
MRRVLRFWFRLEGFGARERFGSFTGREEFGLRRSAIKENGEIL